jgi:hypothetical protein
LCSLTKKVKMKVKNLCSLHHFLFEEANCNYFYGDYTLVQGDKILIQEFNDPLFLHHIGHMSVLEFTKPYFYSINDVAEDSNYPLQNQIDLAQLQSFASFLWFIKDNSVNTNTLYTHASFHKDTMRRKTTSVFSDSKGEYHETKFSYAEIELTQELREKLSKISLGIIPKQVGSYTTPEKMAVGLSSTKPYNTNNRIERALNFLNITRTTSFLPLKISCYIAVFESLFTTDNEAIAHKIGERVAFYVGGDFETKSNNYKIIKQAYNIRSKYFHGQSLVKNKDNLTHLKEVSSEIDQLLRIILVKIINHDGLLFNGNDLNDYLDQIIFK